jgi:hypothetical protein
MVRFFAFLTIAGLLLGCSAPVAEPIDPSLHTATIEVKGMT